MRRSSVFNRCAVVAFTTTWAACSAAPAAEPNPTSAAERASDVFDATGVRGGLVVHLGCGDGRLTAALRADEKYLVHGLDGDPANVEEARRHVQSQGLYGPVSIDRLAGPRLPYIDNLVNLVVAEDPGAVPPAEVMRVLCPNGVAYVKQRGRWNKIVKPRPPVIDEWTHYLYDASNNAVAHDDVVAPPRRMQWVGSPRYSRHHDHMSSLSAAVSAGGRVFYILDEQSPASVLLPPKWSLIARDAFNGTVLWKRPIHQWHAHLWRLKSGPAQLPRRLVAAGDQVYATLLLDGPLVALDATTGDTVRTYGGTQATEEVILSNGVLFALVNDADEKPDYDGRRRFRQSYGAKFWDEASRKIMAVRADTGDVLWATERRVLPGTLAADPKHVVFHDARSIVCLDRSTGQEAWRSEPVASTDEVHGFYLPILVLLLVLYDDVVLFSGGETAGKQTGSWYESGDDTLTALSAEDGKVLWTAYHPPSGYRSPEDLLVADGLVWTGETTSGRAVGVFTGRDPKTGEVKCEFPPDVDIYWFHHRCYRGKATDNYLLMSRAGTEFVDVRNQRWIANHWFRGACLYGVMPANGLIYAPQHPCACYLEAKLYGFNALAPASAGPRVPDDALAALRLEKGPAYEHRGDEGPESVRHSQEWPTYRHDAARSGHTKAAVPAELKPAWQTDLGGRLSSVVVADGRLFVAQIDAHTVCALDARWGKRLWQYTTGGRVDSPPTVYRGRVLFGSADGWVYCLRARDGALAWRYRAAPTDQRLAAFEQIESVWPVHGSVLVEGGVLYCVAGRSMFLDDGLRLLRMDPLTGRVLSETVLNDKDPAAGKDLQDYVSWLNMPTGLPDVLSSDGRLVYMRSQPFGLDGSRLPLEAMPRAEDADRGAPPATQRAEHAHLFSPTGFLDDTWWHRTYWLYGSRFVSGWCGYFLAGKSAAAGRILVFDDSTVYGFGRKPQYFRWTTTIEHQLFAADKLPPGSDEPEDAGPGQSRVRIEKSASLNPAAKALTVQAWVKAEKPGGVILARGGSSLGYALYLKAGRPHFSVRAEGEHRSVAGKEKVPGRWAHLAGVLTDDRKLQIYVDGRLAASTEAPGLIAADPQETMEIGADDGSVVGDYTGPFGLTGLVDEVRLHHRALSPAEIAGHAADTARAAADGDALVLAYSFDQGRAVDESGSENHGTMEGAVVVDGKVGRALRFVGGSSRPEGFAVTHHWTQDLPLFARAMVLAGDTLFLAGPPDIVDEEEAFRAIDDPHVEPQLADQAAAFGGKKGAVLWAVSAADGRKLAEHPLKAPPVFDGLVAAAGRLFLSTQSGAVVCLEGR
ncbi:MAG: outer membrane protein assembly factor BamB family protein [Planctomycetota bacterium]|jgi:outer membrane protein assembly factor BamB